MKDKEKKLEKDALEAHKEFDRLPEEKKAALRKKKEAEHFDGEKAREATRKTKA